jgi:hypothetical protein
MTEYALMDDSKIEDVVGAFVDVRDRLSALKSEWKTIEEEMKLILSKYEMWLRDKADALGVDSFKTKYGTAYKHLKETYRIGNWITFIEYIKETDNFQLLEKRVAKNAAREIHQLEGIPPGLEYFSEFEIGIRRPIKEKEKM